jgi:DNA-binding winged helix-turn-helix (wHTH) protein/Flp pilus assembly protein TadD
MKHCRAIYEFGDFALDTGQQHLVHVRSGDVVPLTGKAFEVLTFLVENASEPLRRETIVQAVWPNVVVEENSLTQIVSSLRELLRERPGENRYIATVPRQGYRFVARVEKWLPPDAGTRLTRPDTQSPEAFALFASGRFAQLRLTEPALLQAIGFYEQALTLDQRYARAHAGIADCHVLLAVLLGARHASAAYPKARAAAETALALDPGLAAAHVSLGQIMMVHARDLRGAEHEYSQALRLDPHNAGAYFCRAVLHTYRGEVDRALDAFGQAMRLEPCTLSIQAAHALTLFHARRYQESGDALRRILELDERFDLARSFLMRVLLAQRRCDEVLAEMQSRVIRGPGSRGFVGQALALAGRRDEARAELARLIELSRQEPVPAFDVAMVHAALDDADNALVWLERAFEDHSPVGTAPLEPVFDQLHSDPRFQRFVARLRGVA